MDSYLDKEVVEYLESRHVCLIGFMGSGKSYLGELLCLELKNELVKIDELIEKSENQSIYEIFREKGEKYFRRVEKRVLEDLVYKSHITDEAQQLEGRTIPEVTSVGNALVRSVKNNIDDKKRNEQVCSLLTQKFEVIGMRQVKRDKRVWRL